MVEFLRHARRVVATAAATAMAVAMLATVSPSPASAHTESSAIYNGCGSGYSVVNDGRRTIERDSDGVVIGKVVLTYNSSNGRNCVVTYKPWGSPYHGEASGIAATLGVEEPDGSKNYWSDDCNGCSHWESISAYGRDRCVMYSGNVRSPNGFPHEGGGAGRNTFKNCGG